MKKQRVLVLVHTSLVPPDTLAGRTQKEIDEWRTEYDVVAELKAAGHEVQILGVLDSLTELRAALLDNRPDVVFNLLEEFNGIVTYDQHVVAFLELMRQPYTGCNPRGLLLARDKVGTAFVYRPAQSRDEYHRGIAEHAMAALLARSSEPVLVGFLDAAAVDDDALGGNAMAHVYVELEQRTRPFWPALRAR